MSIPIDNRQLICRDTLPEILATSNIRTDALLRAVDKELTPMFKLSATSTPSLVVNVGSNSVQNPTSLQYRVNVPLAGNELPFASGTITFPATNNNLITLSNGASVNLNIVTSGNWIKVLVGITSSSAIILTLGTEGNSIANATLPVEPVNAKSLGYIAVTQSAGTVQNVTNDHIFIFNANKYLPLGNVVGTTDTQTLTNKTLTSVIINGVSSDIVPTTTGLYNLGSSSNTWLDLYAENVNINGGSLESLSHVLNIGTISPTTTTINLGTSTTTQIINIGTGTGTKTINIGSPFDTVSITGTLSYANVTNTSISSNHIDLNVGGAIGTGPGSGIVVDELSAVTDTITDGYSTGTQVIFTIALMPQAIVTSDRIAVSGAPAGVYVGNYSVQNVTGAGPYTIYCDNPNALISGTAHISAGVISVVEAISAFLFGPATNQWSFYGGNPLVPLGTLNFFTGAQWSIGEKSAHTVVLSTDTTSQAGYFVPAYDNQYSLGTPSFRWSSINAASIVNSGAVYETGVITTSTTPYIVLATDYHIYVDSSGGAQAVNLQASGSLSNGRVLIITDQMGSSSTKAITITVGSGTTIQGASSFVLNSNFESVTLHYLSATNIWYVI